MSLPGGRLLWGLPRGVSLTRGRALGVGAAGAWLYDVLHGAWPAPFEVPVEPDAPEARDWILHELTEPRYQAAQPTWFDIAMQAFFDWLGSLGTRVAEGPPLIAFVVVGALVLAGVVLAFLLYGLPRLNRRSNDGKELFGEDDDRGSAEIRKSAKQAAADGDWPTAIAEMFRAIARGLAERALVRISPGTTATGFARRAGDEFRTERTELVHAAELFDQVRYLGHPGSADAFAAVEALEGRLRGARPSPRAETAEADRA